MAPLYTHIRLFLNERETEREEKGAGFNGKCREIQCDTSSRLVHTVVQKLRRFDTKLAVIIRRSKLPMIVTVCKCHRVSYDSVLYGVFGFFAIFLLMVLVLD